jgi:ABC-2 type transport system ATP-binding protein
MTSQVVLARGLEKSFGTTRALQGLDFDVAEGTVLSVLGPNGAGKTTAVRILSTLTRADAGHAEVMGFDVSKHPEEVRRSIGLTGQYAALDELLTGRENLVMVGRLFRLSAADARQRAIALLDRFELTDAADRVVKGYLEACDVGSTSRRASCPRRRSSFWTSRPPGSIHAAASACGT